MELDWLKQWSLYSPNAESFKDAETGEAYTYSELYALSCGLARKLELKPGERLAVLANNELEYILLFFAVQRLGAILVPINTRLSAREVAHIENDSAPQALIYQEEFSPLIAGCTTARQLPFAELRAWVRSLLAESRSRRVEALAMRGTAEDACMILYTSGTTGAPKGAMVTNQMLHWNSLNTTLRLNLCSTDVALSFLPFFHTAGWNVLLTPFVHRGGAHGLVAKIRC